MMHRVNIKPLTVNKCWQGKRFKTKDYNNYEKEVLLLLPTLVVPDGNLEIRLKFGVSSKLSDWDNPIKPFQDILQKKYGFDDRRIYKAVVEKEIVKKGGEYIVFEIKELKEHYKNETKLIQQSRSKQV